MSSSETESDISESTDSMPSLEGPSSAGEGYQEDWYQVGQTF